MTLEIIEVYDGCPIPVLRSVGPPFFRGSGANATEQANRRDLQRRSSAASGMDTLFVTFTLQNAMPSAVGYSTVTSRPSKKPISANPGETRQ
jgi:hypothetical protein